VIEIDEEKANDIIKGFSIPPQPETLAKLHQIKQNEYPDLNEIANLVAADVGLSAYILKTINSSAYGLNRSVSDVKQGAMFLGIDALYNLMTFYELKKTFKEKDCCISLERFWDTSAEMANMCSLAVKHLNLKSDCPVEYAYTIGLFHDCGIPAMATKFPDYIDILKKINNNQNQLFTVYEEEQYNTNHATVAYFVLTSWNMPKIICEFVARHHDPTLLTDSKSEPMMRDLFALLKLVNNIHSHHRLGVDDTEWNIHKPYVLAHFRMSDEDLTEFESDLIDDFLVA